MPYSLVGASALGYDLARLPHGQQVASVVRTALRCEGGDLARLAARHPGAVRDERWQLLESLAEREPMGTALSLADQAMGPALLGDVDGSSALLQRLEDAVLGNVGALDRMVRHEVLDWTWLRSGDLAVQDPHASRAADVLVDAAASAYASASMPQATRRQMATPYLTARLRLVDDEPGTGHPEVDRLVAVVSVADAGTRAAWRTAVDDLRPGTTHWAPAMHQATWALYLSGRLRLGTDAQLAAVEAFRAGGFAPRDAAHGVWNALSGAVQATAAADLLPVSERRILMRVWHRVYGYDVLRSTGS